ncbi:MAG: zf-HC2 domain-containing protein [Desulfobacteraceae bacterium]|nr:zf-HC2 domain-containing protein [Desulfobacteraceae bacterium]
MNHLDFENILSDAKAIYGTLKAAPSCPDDEMLSDYVYHDLPTEEHRKIAAHIHQCERCRIESLRMKTDKDAWELMIDKFPDEMFEKLLGSSISEHDAADMSKIIGSAVSKIRDSLIRWLSPVWEPMWAGLPISAASDVPEQSHSFEMNYGEYVNISCYWQEKAMI